MFFFFHTEPGTIVVVLKDTAKRKCTQQCHNEFYVHKWHGNRFLILHRPRRYWLTFYKKKKKERETSITMLAISLDSHVDVHVIRVRLCAGNLELLLPYGRHDKYSGWKTKVRIIYGSALYDLTICCLFVYLTTTSYVLLLYLHRFSWICSDTPPDDDTQFWGQSHFQHRLQIYM